MSKYIGVSIPRVDTISKVIGTTCYATDITLPGMVYVKLVRSQYAHAKILNINTKDAYGVSGVRAIVTGKDLGYKLFGYAIKDQPILAIDKVRFVGDPVAAVIADSLSAAEEAAIRVQVDYQHLPASLELEDALKPEAPAIHEHIEGYVKDPFVRPLGGNICHYAKLRRGDVQKGFAQSKYVFEHTFKLVMVQHCTLEPHACVALADRSGKVTVWSGMQSVHFNLNELSRLFSLKSTKLRLITPPIGGGFGSKHSPKIEPIVIAIALRMPGIPVKMVLNREEEFIAGTVRHPMKMRIKTGLTKEGKFISREVEIWWDTGAYADAGPLVCRNSTYMAPGPYLIPNINVDAYCVYTNKQVAGAFRGYGTSQYCFAYENHLDIIAEKIGIDPLKLRLQNLLAEGDSTHTGEILHSVGAEECLLKAAEAISWGKKEEGIGKGLALMWRASHAPTHSSAIVKIADDGCAHVFVGTSELGQGSQTILSQIAAEELGIDIDSIKILDPDTDISPPDRSTTSSRSTFHMGNAVRLASIDVKKQLVRLAANRLSCLEEKVCIENGEFYMYGSEKLRINIRDLLKGTSIIGTGVFSPNGATGLDPETGQGKRPTAFWMFAAQGVKLKVDQDTGVVQIEQFVSAHDVGKAINPLNCIQQIEGAVGMGIGASLWEEIQHDINGNTINANFADYRMPTALDIPSTESILVEAPHREGPYGAKGLGEPAMAPATPAIASAIYDAVKIRLTETPITPERILRAITKLS